MTRYGTDWTWRDVVAGVLGGLALLLAALCGGCRVAPAQQVHVANYHGSATFRGWVRRLIDWPLELERGTVDGCTFVRGPEVAPGLRVLDVRVELAAGEVRELDLREALGADTDEPTAAAVDVWPRINGRRMLVRSTQLVGAGLDVHWRTRVGSMLVVDLWATLYPGQTWVAGELQVTACNPEVPDVVGVTPPEGIRLEAGPGTVALAMHGQPIVPGGMSIAASQGWPTVPVLVALEGGDAESAAAAWSIGCMALRQVWPGGNPAWPSWQGSGIEWAHRHYGAVTAALQGWSAHSLGIVADARTTGGEGDQVWPGGALGMGRLSAGAELVARHLAYGYVRRPGHWLEADGEPLRIADHPDLCLYGAVPFRNASVGTRDFLGKPRNPTTLETRGWWCWDEHEYSQWLFVAWRATGSPALQWQIQLRARKWLFEQTTDPRFSTTWRTGPARVWAWKSLAAVGIWQTCTDRALADAVADRWRLFWERGGAPRWGNARFWDVRNDPRWGAEGWGAYQCAIAAYATDLAGEVFDVPAARAAALIGARAIVDHAYSWDGTRWKGWHVVRLQNGEPPAELIHHDTAIFGPGTEAWMVTAPAVVVKHEPGHARARAILEQALAEMPERGQWIPPEVAQR